MDAKPLLRLLALANAALSHVIRGKVTSVGEQQLF